MAIGNVVRVRLARPPSIDPASNDARICLPCESIVASKEIARCLFCSRKACGVCMPLHQIGAYVCERCMVAQRLDPRTAAAPPFTIIDLNVDDGATALILSTGHRYAEFITRLIGGDYGNLHADTLKSNQDRLREGWGDVYAAFELEHGKRVIVSGDLDTDKTMKINIFLDVD